MEIDNYISRLSKAAKAYKDNKKIFDENEELLDKFFSKIIQPLVDTWEKGELAYQEYLKIDKMPPTIKGRGKCGRCHRFFNDGEGILYTFGKNIPTKVCKICYDKLMKRQKSLLIDSEEEK
jgi:hypothetical protein